VHLYYNYIIGLKTFVCRISGKSNFYKFIFTLVNYEDSIEIPLSKVFGAYFLKTVYNR